MADVDVPMGVTSLRTGAVRSTVKVLLAETLANVCGLVAHTVKVYAASARLLKVWGEPH